MEFTVTQSYILASSVVLFYDFILTIPQEVKCIWSRKLKLVDVLVLALRYTAVFGYIPALVMAFAVPFHGSEHEGGYVATVVSKDDLLQVTKFKFILLFNSD
ncbi:hypothetical protein SCHPADRAFT_224753 [Schizopora paradoxa]|uniref:DUF6533 domain-containing protein n=1 Tax=Schizopora paradoxa TaxID=27342 RepID=A0A0H2S353_9AGAM|nr:hypothetical protein SCHPADRAFT_224753 [Schizopora paradoxa]